MQDLNRRWRVITRQQQIRQDELVNGITMRLQERLHQVLAHPQPGGKKVIIHIGPDRLSAWIELPPETLEVRT